MSTNQIASYLTYANLQMAAEALYGYELTSSNPVALTKPVLDAAVLIKGNDHASKFPEALADRFVNEWEILAHQPNTSSGFSGTLFRYKGENDPTRGLTFGDLVLSFRSTEFIDDALRDSVGTNESIGTTGGWAFGQIADMEAWYAELSKPGGPLASRSFIQRGQRHLVFSPFDHASPARLKVKGAQKIS
ncbi:MAG: hypothetical protein F9K30_08730 [Dechloromonas sp.]|nr:MAG: hypothetical protein F9K30_08730 [Dechloromonas sp.]